MHPTYPAILRAGVIEWQGVVPPADPVRVQVTVLGPLDASPQSGPLMANALDALAAAGGPSGFDGDPVEWQRESRVDRPLPGRAE